MIEQSIKNLIKRITGIKPTPAFSVGPFPAISYTLSPYSEGPVCDGQLEVRVMGPSLDECLEIRNKIIEEIQTDIQQPSITESNYVMRLQVAGGGWLFNSETQMWEYPTIFTIKWRSKND